MALIKTSAKPSSLYRYRPLGAVADREIDALLKGYIYCPAFSDMNESMEGAHSLSARLSTIRIARKVEHGSKRRCRRWG